MTRTDVMASSRPQTPGAALKTTGSRARRKLVTLPVLVVMALALLVPATAPAAEGTSGYNQEPNKPGTTTTTTTPTTTPSAETSPSKEAGTPTTTPEKETEPTQSASSPAKESAKTLPFTGFDLRWSFAIGLALMVAGFAIVGVQRRRSNER